MLFKLMFVIFLVLCGTSCHTCNPANVIKTFPNFVVMEGTRQSSSSIPSVVVMH